MNAITKTEGPCVVLAGAGTGKTYTIVEKIKHLVLNKNVDAGKIVCITFSNEAANNLVLRVKKLLGDKLKDGKEPVIRTFHGFSADLLREFGEKIGVNSKFRILDPDQAKVILHRNLKVNAGNCHKYIGTIGTVKDLGIKIEEFERYLEKREKEYDKIDLEKRLENLSFELHTMHLSNFKGREDKADLVKELFKVKNLIEIRKFVNAWRAYEKLKEKGNYLDYSDLNNYALKLLEKNPEIAENYEYFIVDEFQDTNKVQLDFLIKLAWNGNITIVGDLNQSIYRFRGAYRKNLELFRSFFNVKSSDIFNLDKSFRSSNRILRIAHKLILNNYENKDDCLFVENVHGREGDEAEVYELEDAREETRKVIEIVKSEINSGKAEEDICIIFRAHQYGRIIRKALEQEGIDYCAVSKQSLLKQKSIKTVIDYLTILNKLKKKEKGGEQAWWDLAYQLNFSNEDLMKIGRFIKDFNKSFEKDKEKKENNDEEQKNGEIISVKLFNSLSGMELSSDGKMASKILIDKIKSMLNFANSGISELLREVYRISGLQNEQRTREEKEIMLNLNRFYEKAKEHEELYDSDLSNFLYYLEILESLGIEIPAAEIEEKGIRLMTSHATKGLEYKTVIITNMASKRFPIETYRNNSLIPTELLPEIKEDVEKMSEEDREYYVENYERKQQVLDERRLCYVSFTRAKEKLILTYAKKYGNRKSFPSMFLHELGFKGNEDILFKIDRNILFKEPELEIKKAFSLTQALGSKDFDSVIGEIVNGDREKDKEKEHKRFSPSALLLFDECQKQFEYKYVYNMPEKKTVSWEAMRLGSFVHIVLQKGVSLEFESVDKFLELAREMSLDSDWESVDFNEAETLIRVFFERNRSRFNEKSKTEQYLPLQIAGMDFIGFADRIDFNENGEIGIVDYKTGKANVAGKNRNWQLGFYALAAKDVFEKDVKKVTLDMLRQDKPLEFEIDEKGNAFCVSSDRIEGFNIYEVESELVQTAHRIQEAYKFGFKACPIEKNCEFCNEYVYGL